MISEYVNGITFKKFIENGCARYENICFYFNVNSDQYGICARIYIYAIYIDIDIYHDHAYDQSININYNIIYYVYI
jgi:hypothetical protein